ncbi:beta-1,6-N-acetylglucosaminyltransferase [Sphingobacterium sp. lm-10]|uniref:beta-1,6-N-acetylglucosaminyltransferase n=1 Tax=Sphingobacterium sp. lm-10 TaxID=2944904 RepID=UPI002021EE95|nr:beta-1,6-N-acetylglucosaminyltransferase [Sphingobacterium sp. lm-10]MCL7988412.1 beta-1,6-N-acetylglucosaminyltransferase [Sphingobacterium sp. lm-10]
MDRHAYLILAHADFHVLSLLIDRIDDPNNDVFIHFDKKVKHVPKLITKWSHITIIDDPVDIRWGHLSMLEAEYKLFESAIRNADSYRYYHLISGTHYPICSKADIQAYFRDKSENILMPMDTSSKEIELKLNRYNLFVKNFNHRTPFLKKLDQLFWHGSIKIQQWLNIKRRPIASATKASQWMSLNRSAILYLLKNKKLILARYNRTLCPDEFFIPSTLNAAPENFDILFVNDLLFCEFEGPNPRVFMESDLETLKTARYLFARKFNDKNSNVIHALNKFYSLPK